MTSLYRPKQFAERHADRGVTLPSLRWQIHRHRQRLIDHGVLVRPEGSRNLWIDEDLYFKWLKSEQ